jgi:hypothetical protein
MIGTSTPVLPSGRCGSAMGFPFQLCEAAIAENCMPATRVPSTGLV